MASSARGGLNNMAEGGKVASEGVLKAAAGFAVLGLAVNAMLSKNKDWQQATGRLTGELSRLGDSIASTVGPKASKFVDAFTIGMVYLSHLISGAVAPALATLMKVIDRVIQRIGVAAEILEKLWSGDVRGALDQYKAAVLSFPDELAGALADIKTGMADLGTAMDDASDAAFEAWKRQRDGIDDTVEGLKKAVAYYKELHAVASTPLPGTGQNWSKYNPEDLRDAAGTPSAGRAGWMPDDEPEPQAPYKHEDLVAAAGTEPLSGKANPVSASIAKAGSGVMGGMTAMMGYFGAIHGAVAGILEFMKTFGDQSVQDAQLVIDTVMGLGDQFMKTIIDVPMMIISKFPDMLASILTLIPRIILGLIASGPKIIAGVVKAIVSLPKTIIDEFQYMFEQFWIDMKQFFNDLFDFKGKNGGFLGTNLGKEAEQKRFLFIHIGGKSDSQMATSEFNAQNAVEGGGGSVSPPRTHPSSQTSRMAGSTSRTSRSSSPANVTINVQGVRDVDDLVRKARTRLGSYGIGLTLDPYRGG